ncbi:hypothetical protein DFJ58DRAFT_918204 [Suillus subalutaceus]|uniref:uncharacterized protein n=1 Tax=Suillus subalutaceus TaxID=48586 RepID=UPI001B8810D1|nr:uncharacterized protein DFJ58DRAFT_918204 [Suillus subalutaceus]KAG1831953.1 hypothetical protein DFJ58DRAFT_918204 [Suillus subalutaceus]
MIAHVQPQDAMTSAETKSIYIRDLPPPLDITSHRDPLATSMSFHLPTFLQLRSEPANGSGVCNVITSSDGHLKLSATMSAEKVQTERYNKRKFIPRNTKNYIIPCMTTDPIKRPVPPGWQIYIHPEGCLYYCYDSVVDFHGYSRRIHIITQADLVHDGIAETIENLAKLAYSHAYQYPSFPVNVDLVLELMDVRETITAGYYFVHHENRCLFWLQDFNATGILRECCGVTELSHIQIELEAQYCRGMVTAHASRKHIDLFPHTSSLHSQALQQLQQIIRFAISDCMTSEVSAVCAFSIDVLKNTLDLIKDVDVENDWVQSAHDKCFIARMMNHFRHCQYLNYHGQQGARLSRDQTVHDDSYEERSMMMRCLAPLLFNAPYEHVRSLHKLYVDSIVNQLDWRTFVQKLNAEMQDFNLLATVLLSVNVGFLAIQSVDHGRGHSLSQVASYVSVISSFGSMLLGVNIARQSYTRGPDMVDNAQARLESLVHPKHGLETLAIIYSLPYALLMWGMIFFVLAFFTECFRNSSAVPVSVAALIVLVLVGWSCYTLGDSVERGHLFGSVITAVQWIKNLPRWVVKPNDKESAGSALSYGGKFRWTFKLPGPLN